MGGSVTALVPVARVARVSWWRRLRAWWRTRQIERDWRAAEKRAFLDEKRRIIGEFYDKEPHFRSFVERQFDKSYRRAPVSMPIPGDGAPRS